MAPLEFDLVGAMVGEFRVVEKIGEGGFGIVYRAKQDPANANRDVALKIIRPARGFERPSPSQAREFAAEAAKLARLDHPGIVRFVSWGWFSPNATTAPFPYLVTQWVDGRPITAAMRGRPLREKIAAFIAVCDAVQSAHRGNLAHFDLKPANVLVRWSDRFEPVVLDFGIAQWLSHPLAGEGGPCTLLYASPEQLDGRFGLPGFRTDVYALGVLLFELLTDALPYRWPGRDADLGAHLTEAITSPQCRRSLQDFPEVFDARLGAIVRRALEIDPARRIGSPAELARELAAWMAPEPAPAVTRAPTPSSANPGAISIVQGDGSFASVGNMNVTAPRPSRRPRRRG